MYNIILEVYINLCRNQEHDFNWSVLDMSGTISKETADMVLNFRDERNWKQFHNPKDLAISICLEAAELLEVFQWSGSDLSIDGKTEKIKEELADIANYCILMADRCNLDLDQIIREKVIRNAEKYPVEKARNKATKYTEL